MTDSITGIQGDEHFAEFVIITSDSLVWLYKQGLAAVYHWRNVKMVSVFT